VTDGVLGATNLPSWVFGDMTNPTQATNTAMIQQGLLYSSVNNVKVYHCPADTIPQASEGEIVPHIRSYSMQPQLAPYYDGSNWVVEAAYPPMYNENDIRAVSPSSTIVFLDESPATINDGYFNAPLTGNAWASDLPAYWHNHGDNFSFADGHAEHWRWQDPRTSSPTPNSGSAPFPDLTRLQSCLGYRYQ
jgi:prepilin-type processing-associated H-X9-DG protein